MESIAERAKSLADLIFRREGYLKSAKIAKLIEEELEKQKKIDDEYLENIVANLKNRIESRANSYAASRFRHPIMADIIANDYCAIAPEERRRNIKFIREWIEENKQPVLASEFDDTVVGYSISVENILECLKTLEEE